MKKLLLTFLLILMPLQFAQAAMCAYCCDEETSSSISNSKHETAADIEQHSDVQDLSESHHNCGACHLSCAKYFVSQSDLFQPFELAVTFHPQPIGYQSYIPRGLDRPNWTHFA